MNGTIDMSDDGIDFSDIEAKYQVPYEEGFDTFLVVDNLPIVDASRKDKLLSVLSKHFVKKGGAPKPKSMFMPWDDATNKSKGFVFAEFATADEANIAMAAVHGSHLDKEHPLIINKLTDIEKFANLDEAYVEPEIEEYEDKEHLRSWLADPQGRDQYLTYRDDWLTIHWHSKPPAAEPVKEGQNWTELYAAWSPQGTYLVSLHRQGIRPWGGASWKGFHRMYHPGVKLVAFSPNENYVVTWSPESIFVPDNLPAGVSQYTEEDEGNQIAVWDIKTGALLRTFPPTPVAPNALREEDPDKRKPQIVWPALKWSPDEKYVARITPGVQISVYELPSMGLSGKKSVKIEGVVDFEWCPLGDRDREAEEREGKKGAKKERENMFAYWTPEITNQPARVTLTAFPSRTVLRSKNLFNVSDCKIYWQNSGDFLCVKVDRHTKTKKSIFCNLEIFRVREKDYPVEVIELKDTVLDFAWEPQGERFVIIHSADANPAPGVSFKTDVSFYAHDKSKNIFKLLKAFPNKNFNTIRWSPRGRHVVFTTIGNSNAYGLEFYDLDFTLEDRREGSTAQPTNEWGSTIQLISPPNIEHFAITDIEWDPSGRYVTTSASFWRHNIENGFTIWDFRGIEIEKNLVEKFKQFLWRPRPRTLLTKDQIKAIRRNLKEYSRTFDEEDALEKTTADRDKVAQRRRLIDEWNAWRAKVRKEKGVTKEVAKEEVQEWVEELIEVIEEVQE